MNKRRHLFHASFPFEPKARRDMSFACFIWLRAFWVNPPACQTETDVKNITQAVSGTINVC